MAKPLVIQVVTPRCQLHIYLIWPPAGQFSSSRERLGWRQQVSRLSDRRTETYAGRVGALLSIHSRINVIKKRDKQTDTRPLIDAFCRGRAANTITVYVAPSCVHSSTMHMNWTNDIHMQILTSYTRVRNLCHSEVLAHRPTAVSVNNVYCSMLIRYHTIREAISTCS